MNFSLSWGKAEQARLVKEKNVLEHHFPGNVVWIEPTNRHNSKVEVTLKTDNDNKYTLKIYIGNFSNALPHMVVVSSPKPMPIWGESYQNHTLSRHDGYFRISHSHSSQWSDRCTLYDVIMKGRVWLEAYEGHIRTGKPVNCLVKEMDKRGSEVNERRLADVIGSSSERQPAALCVLF